MARFTPDHQQAKFFGFYAFSGKVTTFAGPILVGTMTALFDSVRIGMGMVVIFFVAGGLVLTLVNEEKGIEGGMTAKA
jgi:UMF1 family MFS transporter